MKIFEKTTIQFLGNALKAYSLRQKTIATNIANIATPGYRAQDVSFERELAGAMGKNGVQVAQTNPKHFSLDKSMNGEEVARVVEVGRMEDSNDLTSGVNNVDIDKEMGELAENQLRYRFAARMLSETFKGIQKSIRGHS